MAALFACNASRTSVAASCTSAQTESIMTKTDGSDTSLSMVLEEDIRSGSSEPAMAYEI